MAPYFGIFSGLDIGQYNEYIKFFTSARSVRAIGRSQRFNPLNFLVGRVLRHESRVYFALNFRANFPFSDLKVVTRLQVQPELWSCAKVTSKP